MRWAGRYEEQGTLGEGVFLVRDRYAVDDREVVLKELGAVAGRTREELAREFRTLVGLRHPGIVRVLDFGGGPGGATWLTFERVPGETLERVLPGARPEVVRVLLGQAADALAWAHRHGVLHGDLKPGNVLGSLEPVPRLVLIDFGLARAVVGEERGAGGTPGWVAPELAAGGRPTVASDLYGLGAAFWGALCGEAPAVVPAVRAAQRARVPEAVAPLLEALLDSDPARRPVDAEAVLRRLGVRPTAGTAAPPFVGRRADLDLLCRRSAGAILLRGPVGSGRTRLLAEARWRLQLEGRPVYDLARGPDPATEEATAGGEAPVVLADDIDRLPRDRQAVLARRLAYWVRERRAGVLLAAEEAEAIARLSAAVPGLELLELGPLDRVAVAALVAASLGRADEVLAERLFERSGGVPLFAVDLLRGLGSCTEAGEADPACVALSAAAAAAVRERLAALPSGARELAGLLAALGRAAPVDELRALGGELADDAFAALARAGLAVERAGRWALAVPAAAAAILGPAAPAVHGRLAERLARAGAEESEVDRQRAAAGDPDAALRAARRLAEAGAGREALALLGPSSAALFAAWSSRPDRVLEWADLCAAAGEHAAVRDRLLPLAAAAEPAIRGQVLLRLGEALERLGELAAAGERLAEALPLLERPAERAAARRRLARIALLAGDAAAAREHARAGLAAQGGEEAGLRLQLGAALSRLGEPDGAREALGAARAAAEAAGDARTAAAALGHLAMLHAAEGDAVRARELYGRALAEAEAAQDVTALPAHLLNLATVHRTLRDPGAALELLRRAEALARRLGRTGPLGAALINLANLYVEVGAAAEARSAAREAAELAAGSGVRLVAAQAELVLAEAEAWSDPAAARRHAAAARGTFGALGDGGRAAEAAVLEGELALALGDLETAQEALAAARAGAPPGLGGRLALLEGNLARATGASAAAVERLEAALAAGAAAGDEDLAARAELALGELLDEAGSPLASGRRRRAAERLSEAALRLPPALREAFWSVPHRARARAAAAEPAGGSGRGTRDAALRLLALAPGMLAERDAQRVLERALDAGLDVLGGERGFLLLRDGTEWRVAAARNIDRESIRRAGFKFSRSVAEQVADSGEPVLTASAVDDPRFAAARSVHQLALQSIVCVPIRSPDRVLGTIYVENRFSRGRFDAEHLRLAQALADQVALALEAGRLERELRERAEELERARAELARRVELQEDELARLEREVRRSRDEPTLRHEYAGIIGRGPAMRRLLQTVDRVAETSLPVLIEGATGTGKELVARALHANGPRRGRPFVGVNCGALPDLLLESELFGHARGAFTGADRARPGLMREASGGTLFLDEIGETSPALQVKLLRALQSAEVTPLGTDRPVPVDVRVVAATNRDLARQVAEGKFREDLFYRLNVVRLRVPPLVERREDLPELAAHFLARLAAQTGGAPKRLGRAALRALLRHDFPGNVRELENLLATAAVFAPGEELRPEDLPLSAAGEAAAGVGGSRREQLRATDRRLVERALRDCGYNLSAAARKLGVSRPTVYRWLRAHGLGRRGAT